MVRVLLVFVFSVSIISARSQNTLSSINAFGFPSQNNQFLTEPGGESKVGVDLYTGKAEVSIAICQLPSKKLNIPVSFSYASSGGIKIQDYATCVGLGWQLNAGGGITRVVRGFPDESPNGYIAGGWGNLIAANWTGTYGISQGGMGVYGALTPTQITQLKGEASDGTPTTPSADGEPDLYFVSTLYFSMQFVMDGNGKPVFANSPGFTVAFSSNKFVVTDEQGTQYFFGSTSNSVETSSTSFYGTSISYISTWYLDKIVSFNSADILSLTYQASTYNDQIYHYQYTKAVDSFLDSVRDSTPQITTIYNPKYVKTIVSLLGEM